MIDRRQIAEILDRVQRYQRPVLSLYATTDPAQPDATGVRVRNTLRALEGIPDQAAERVEAFFDGRVVRGRSVVLFTDGESLDALELALDATQNGARDHLDAHVGDPYFTPLLAAMNEHEPYLVLAPTRDRIRAYRVFLGQAEELAEMQREPVAAEQDEPGRSKNLYPAGTTRADPTRTRSAQTPANVQNRPKPIADRGDAAIQLTQERIEHSQHAFYAESGKRLHQLMDDLGIEQIIVMGVERNAQLLRSALPPEMAKRVAAVESATPTDDPTESVVLDRVRGTVERLQQAKKERLLDDVRERGIWGVTPCLDALQQGKLYVLAVPRSLEIDAFVGTNTGYVALTEREARGDGSDEARSASLETLLPRLADDFGVKLEFLSGEAERRLVEELGGMAGLQRWS